MRDFKIGDKVEFEMSKRLADEPKWNFDDNSGGTGKYQTGEVVKEGDYYDGPCFQVRSDLVGSWWWPQPNHPTKGNLYRTSKGFVRLVGGGGGESGKIRLVDKGGYYMTEVIK